MEAHGSHPIGSQDQGLRTAMSGLTISPPAAQQGAAWGLLAFNNEANRVRIAEAQCHPTLARLLGSSSLDVQETAAGALKKLAKMGTTDCFSSSNSAETSEC